MEKFAQFGVEPILLAAQIINFLVLLYLLKRFLYKPVLDMLKKREEKIKEGLSAAEKGEALLVKAKEEEKKILTKAGEEAGVVIAQAKERGTAIAEEFLSKAKEESEQILSDAKGEIDQEKKRIEMEIERKVIQTSLAHLEVILPKVLSKQDHLRILEGGEKLLRKAVSS